MKKLYEKFLKITESEKMTEEKLFVRLYTSVFTIFISVVILCSTTYAYFTNTVTSGIATIQAANYGVTAIVTTENETPQTVTNGKFICEEKLYTFQLQVTGNNENAYLIYTINDTVYYTNPMAKDSVYTFKLNASADTKVTFIAQWGTHTNTVTESGKEINPNSNVAILIEEIITQQYTLHTVTEGETLETIALFYGITVEEICEYNDITADTELIVDQQIAIPIVIGETESEESVIQQYTLHTVAEGETLENIAELYAITVEEIAEYNNISADTVLVVGQQIEIPVIIEKEEQEEIEPASSSSTESTTSTEITDELNIDADDTEETTVESTTIENTTDFSLSTESSVESSGESLSLEESTVTSTSETTVESTASSYETEQSNLDVQQEATEEIDPIIQSTETSGILEEITTQAEILIGEEQTTGASPEEQITTENSDE